MWFPTVIKNRSRRSRWQQVTDAAHLPQVSDQIASLAHRVGELPAAYRVGGLPVGRDDLVHGLHQAQSRLGEAQDRLAEVDLPDREDWAGWTDRIAGPGAHNIAVGRVGVGVALTLRPTLLPRVLGVDSTTARRVAWLSRMAGARDLALGVGHLHAAAAGEPTARWVIAGAACDTADAVALLGAVRRGHVRRSTGVLAGVAAVVCAVCAVRAVR